MTVWWERDSIKFQKSNLHLPSSALCLRSIVVLRFFIFFDISQNMIIFARFKSSSEAQLNFLRESSTLGYVRHYDLDRSCN